MRECKSHIDSHNKKTAEESSDDNKDNNENKENA
jgi:hypothetical protein